MLSILRGFFVRLFKLNHDGRRGYFFYSQGQRTTQNHVNGYLPANKVKLDSGEIVEYTEMNSRSKLASGKWEDYIYLGQGKIYSVRGVVQGSK